MTVRTLNKLIADGEKVTVDGFIVRQVKSLRGVIEFLTTRGVVKYRTEDAVVEIEGKQVNVEPSYRRKEK